MAENWKARIDPGLKSIYRKLPNITFGPWRVRAFRWLESKMPAPPVPEGVIREHVDLNGRTLWVHRPKDKAPSGSLMWIHGGGRMMGTPAIFHMHAARLVQELGLFVVAPEHRLGPEHPFPAGLNDLHDAWRWMIEQGHGSASIGGESAGGGLAAELSQRLLDEGGPLPACQLLVYPMLDDRTATSEEKTDQRYLVWNNQSNHLGWKSYLGTEPGSVGLPPYAAAARRDDLSGLPPAWIVVGDLDIFWDEDHTYAARLAKADVPHELLALEGAFHGFFVFGSQQPAFLRVWESMTSFLQTHGIAQSS